MAICIASLLLLISKFVFTAWGAVLKQDTKKDFGLLSEFTGSKHAIAVSNAGAFAIVVECVIENLAKKITKAISIPTIGIGSSKYCDGQILVTEDMIGMSSILPKFVKQYSNINKIIEKSVKNYVKDVKMKRFPSSRNVYK